MNSEEHRDPVALRLHTCPLILIGHRKTELSDTCSWGFNPPRRYTRTGQGDKKHSRTLTTTLSQCRTPQPARGVRKPHLERLRPTEVPLPALWLVLHVTQPDEPL